MSERKMPRRKATVSPLAGWDTSTTLPDGRTIELGDEFTVEGEGRFRLRAIRPNGELNAWGRLTAWGSIPRNGVIKHGSMRTFKPERVKRIHRVNRAVDTRRAAEEEVA